VNGVRALHLDAAPGEPVRLRLISAIPGAEDGAPQEPVLLGAPYVVAALDGHDLHEPQVLPPERLPLEIGQRIDLAFTMPATGAVRLVDALGDEAVTIGSGAAPAVPSLGGLARLDLTRYGTPAFDPLRSRSTFDVTYPFVLDTHPGFREGTFEIVHTINGAASPYGPMLMVRPGQAVRLHIVNRTSESHPIHLHGHVFTLLALDGAPFQGSPIRQDTVLVGPQQTVDVAFLADNPGLWMIHCHILMHAATGMSAMVVYPHVSTPYSIGTRSGNLPE
jgi:FtsP/CotA-like multicopper oxidase with cupredoxin domain